MIHAAVRQLSALDVAPQQFDRIEFRRVPRKTLDHQPPALAVDVVLHHPALVRREAVPDQQDSLAVELAPEALEELDQCLRVVVPFQGPEEEPRLLTIPPKAESGGYRQLLPVEAMSQDRRLPSWRPRPAHRRSLGDAALVLEHDPRLSPLGFFFSTGQCFLFHSRIAFSLRSLARLVGRCKLQPNFRMSFQTWPR